jgi:hypothetical protein
MAQRMFYNTMEIPSKIRFISKECNIDETIDTSEDCGTFPVWFPDLFKALKKGVFDEIVVTVSSHNECYFYTTIGERRGLVGEISLSEYSDGGEYLKDIRLMLDKADSE